MIRTRVDAEAIAAAILRDLDELATLSAPGRGVTRLAFGSEDAGAREWFKRRCDELELTFRVDRVGNCFGFPPRSEERKPILVGSHLDSVPGGGAYDGALGVVAGLRLAEWCLEHRPEVPVAVASFACEESSRFGFGSIGSRYFAGELEESAFADILDTEGCALSELLDDAGLSALGPTSTVRPSDFRGYVEAHIDQGTTLTSAGATLGVVSAIAGVQRTRIVWTGEAAHSGGRLRSDRRDALLAAAEFVVRANDAWCEAFPDEQSLALTVGRLTVEPNRPNTVAGRVEMIVDVRSADSALTGAMLRRLDGLMSEVAGGRRVDVASEELGRSEGLAMDESVARALDEAAAAVDGAPARCVSLAGHDALVLGRVIPAGMLLLANPSGISHAPEEDVDHRAVVDCVAALAEALPRLTATQEPR
jgi:hydantoinase/carbamoylase family amidase